MEINMQTLKKLTNPKIFILLFLACGLLASGLSQDSFKKDIKGEDEDNQNSKLEDSKILLDSIVILKKSNTNTDLSGFEAIGSFYYQEKPSAEVPKSNESNSSLSKSIEKTYKLVKVPGNRYMISDGSFIVGFKDISDQERFAEDFNLVIKSNFRNKAAYFSKGFNGLEELIKDIKNDSRVSSFELDLIDPNIKAY